MSAAIDEMLTIVPAPRDTKAGIAVRQAREHAHVQRVAHDDVEADAKLSGILVHEPHINRILAEPLETLEDIIRHLLARTGTLIHGVERPL